jgi:AraC-like DNA-binding protein
MGRCHTTKATRRGRQSTRRARQRRPELAYSRGVALQACASHDELVRDPVGRWLPTGSGLVWCHSPTLCGMAVWERPRAAEVRTLLRVFDGYRALAPRFDVMQDASGVEGIDLDALGALFDWLQGNRHILRDHVRRRIGVIPPGVAGLALAGIAPVLALEMPVTIVTAAREGFRELLPEGGDQLHDEVERLIAQVRSISPLVLALRRVLAETGGALDLPGAARRLGVSVRSLQRELAGAGLAFRTEQADARFRAAEELLRGGDKLAAVAARLGLSDDGLTKLIRARTGLTPGDLRRRLREGSA